MVAAKMATAPIQNFNFAITFAPGFTHIYLIAIKFALGSQVPPLRDYHQI
jgi:hypothetical protein